VFRNSLGSFATGVTIVTCIDSDGEPQGVTANSFASVSLEPQLVLWNIGKSSSTLEHFRSAQQFAINILSADQEALSTRFAQSGEGLFENLAYATASNGAPVFEGALTQFVCQQHDVHEAGDHYIIVGEVLEFVSREGAPLVFYRGGFASLAGK